MELTALTLSLEENLRPLSGFLWQQGIRHRIYEENGMQVLRVENEQDKAYVCDLYARWKEGEVRIIETPGEPKPPSPLALRARLIPVTIALILLSFVGFLLPYLNQVPLVSLFTFSDFELVDRTTIQFKPHEGQYWRLLTPIFLHFGWLHIAFNSLWVWELGGRIERLLGGGVLLFMVIFTGVGSNMAQHLYSVMVDGRLSLFGGMSGVVYALLGFCWIAGDRMPGSGLKLPRAVVLFMLGWLVFCMVGPTALLGAPAIANAAHLGGLVLGCALGFLFLKMRPRSAS